MTFNESSMEQTICIVKAIQILHFLNPPSMGISGPSSKSHIIFGSHVKFSCYSRSWEMSLYLIPKAMSFLKNIIRSLLNGTLLTMLNPLAWVMGVAAIMAIALANGRVTDLKFSTVFKYATTVNHLIGSFRTSGIGVALSGPDGGCPPNCCITCSGCSSTLLTIADACVMLIGEGCFTHLCLYMSLLNPTSTSEVMLCTCRNGLEGVGFVPPPSWPGTAPSPISPLPIVVKIVEPRTIETLQKRQKGDELRGQSKVSEDQKWYAAASRLLSC
ncbi:uncharacterized protein LOC110941170 [Helianthus annuus]|uniref:uncharacterized protein LOC110941170 n=1 Tax=Helianthus annuus TaxID=4232 RepID=UPI000B9057BB|nr:uncharacterized protein LOC110941170 [Helianthus annuus]XP_035846070.1 uncharacterized protein LOC110941170 [Helianthus annuus]